MDPLEGDEHYDAPNGEQVVPWEHLFEYSTTDLESILTPSKAFHKKKFELGLHPLMFISYPIHIREDGTWKKKRPKKAKKPKKDEYEAGNGSGETKSGESEKNGASSKPKTDDASEEDGDDHGGMTMFNVFFVLHVPKEEVDAKISAIYEHVIKKFNKALNHAQASSNYVWKESEMILAMKEKAREESESPCLLHPLTFAKSFRTTYELALGRNSAKIDIGRSDSRCLHGYIQQQDRYHSPCHETSARFVAADPDPFLSHKPPELDRARYAGSSCYDCEPSGR